MNKCREEMITALPNKHYTGNHGTTDEEGDHRTELKSEMGSAGEKMEAAAQDRTGWREVVYGLCSTGSDKALVKSSK